jgi:hypothetical protein
MLELQEMNVQTPLPNTKLATAMIVPQLKQQSAPQALVAVSSLIQPD